MIDSNTEERQRQERDVDVAVGPDEGDQAVVREPAQAEDAVLQREGRKRGEDRAHETPPQELRRPEARGLLEGEQNAADRRAERGGEPARGPEAQKVPAVHVAMKEGRRLVARVRRAPRRVPGIRKPVTFSRLEEAPLSVSFHSFRLSFGRVIISPQVLEVWMLSLKHMIAKHSS